MSVTALGRTTLWIAGAHGVLGALYWALLTTPETNVGTLALSATLVLLLGAVVTVATATAARLAAGSTWRAAIRPCGSMVFAGLAGLLALALVMWIAARIDAVVMAQEGALRALLIVRTGWADATPLVSGLGWLTWWLRFVVAPLLFIGICHAATRGGVSAVGHPATWRRPLRPRALALGTASMLLLIRGAWSLVPWRPEGLPPTWLEPAAAVVKLTLVLMAMSVGWTVLVTAATADGTGAAAPATPASPQAAPDAQAADAPPAAH